MPEQTDLSFYAATVSAISAIIGLIVGGALALIGAGRKAERIESGLARSHARLDEHEELFKTHDTALKNMLASFFTSDGEPRYITSIVCSDKESQCQLRIREDLSRLERDLTAVKTSQDSNLQTILAEIRRGKE